jgi:hypothetical protein
VYHPPHNGAGAWRASRQIAELIEPVAGLNAYFPRQKHVVLDEGRLSEDEIAAGDSTLAEMIRLAHPAGAADDRVAADAPFRPAR